MTDNDGCYYDTVDCCHTCKGCDRSIVEDDDIIINYDDYTTKKATSKKIMNIDEVQKENKQLKEQIKTYKNDNERLLKQLSKADELHKELVIKMNKYTIKLKEKRT